MLTRDQLIEDFDGADNCGFYVTAMKAMNFQDDIPSIPIPQWIQTLTGSYIQNLFRYQQVDLRQTRTLRSGQPIVDFDAADICCFYVTTMQAMTI